MDIALSGTGTPATVLVVDDDPMLADLLAEWVSEKWACETVNSGDAALETLNGTVDLVLLDRRMPGRSGDEVLSSIRDTKSDVQVLMVSSVEPDFDVLDLPFDDFLRKPVDRRTLQEAIEGLLVRRSYKPTIQEFFSATAKIDILETVKAESELAEDERYLALRATADRLRQQSDATLGRMTDHVSELYDAEADD